MKNIKKVDELITEFCDRLEAEGYVFDSLDFKGFRPKRKLPTLKEVEEKVAKRLDIHCDCIHDFLEDIKNIYTSVYINIMLKETALLLDHNYEGHIKDIDTVYFISMIDGHIGHMPTKNVITFKSFAAFRTREDAAYAWNLIEDAFHLLYGSE